MRFTTEEELATLVPNEALVEMLQKEIRMCETMFIEKEDHKIYNVWQHRVFCFQYERNHEILSSELTCSTD